MYRALLNFDDSEGSSSLLTRISVGRWYMIYLCLPYGSRKQRSAIRKISLMRSGISMKPVVDYATPKILKGTPDRLIGGDAD